LPQASHVVSIKDAEKTYALMMHTSSALGVNCTFCHNTQSFGAWDMSRAQRTSAYYGIRMVRDINANYIAPLQDVFPANRKGPHGDVYKVNCTTCHQGVSKPLGGVSMIAQAPSLLGPTLAPVTAAASPVTAAAATYAAPAQLTALGEPAAMTAQQ
jgi:photosynthetic reaction center cytochrome c subunit